MAAPRQPGDTNDQRNGRVPDPVSLKLSAEPESGRARQPVAARAARPQPVRSDPDRDSAVDPGLDDRLEPDWEAFGARAGEVAGIVDDAVFWTERRWAALGPLRPLRRLGSTTLRRAGAVAAGVSSRVSTLAGTVGAGLRRPEDREPGDRRPPVETTDRPVPNGDRRALQRRRDRTNLVRQGSLATSVLAALALVGVIAAPDGGDRLEATSVTTAPTVAPAVATSSTSATSSSTFATSSTSATSPSISDASSSTSEADRSSSSSDPDPSTSSVPPESDREASTDVVVVQRTVSEPTTVTTTRPTTTTVRSTTSDAPTTVTTARRTTATTRPTTTTVRSTITTQPTTTTTRPPTTTTRPTTTSQPTTTTASGPTTTPCASPSWDLVLNETFSGSSVDTSVWKPYDSIGNANYGLRRPSALSVSGGYLTITARMEDGSLVSGGMSHAYDQTYGRYEFRVRTDQDPSETMSGVVLTWPRSGVHPRDGENDIYETLATPGDRHEFYTFIHEPFGAVDDQDATVHPVNASSWHTMVMEWTPDWIKIYRDGVLVKTIDETSDDLIPDVPHHAAIQLDAWDHSLPAEVTMQVDYFKVYALGSC